MPELKRVLIYCKRAWSKLPIKSNVAIPKCVSATCAITQKTSKALTGCLVKKAAALTV